LIIDVVDSYSVEYLFSLLSDIKIDGRFIRESRVSILLDGDGR
jgi:hypothetical protein